MEIPMNARCLALLALPALFALQGCDLLGEEGNLSFRDTTVGEFELDRSVGVGSTIVLEVSCAECEGLSVTSAQSDRPSILEVIGFNGTSISCRGVSDGTALVHVSLGGVEDRIAVDVRPIEDATVRLEPWPDIAALPPVLWAGGAAILAGETVDARAFAKDSSGQRLTGFGGVDWQLDGGGSIQTVADRRSDIVTVDAPSEAGGNLELVPSVGATQALEVIAEWEVSSLRLAMMTNDEPVLFEDGDSLELSSGESLVLQLVGYTADGLYVIGSGTVIAEMTVSESLASVAEDTIEVLAEGSEEDSTIALDAVRRAFERGFLVTATEGGVGEGELTFTWLGQTLRVSLSVAAGE